MDGAEERATPRRGGRQARTSGAAAPAGAAPSGNAEAAAQLSALVQLARRDRAAARSTSDGSARERAEMAAAIPAELLEAYHRALRGGREPALTPLEGSVCCGCHMRLHSSLEQQVHRRGAAACPHCLRVVYDPAVLQAGSPR